MRIFNAKYIGRSDNENKGIRFHYFAYRSKFIEGTGCIVCPEKYDKYPITDKLEMNKYYDLYINNKNGYNNIVRAFEHVDKNTSGNTIDSN